MNGAVAQRPQTAWLTVSGQSGDAAGQGGETGRRAEPSRHLSVRDMHSSAGKGG